jgi:8-amino-7-oxononanoate synthase
MTQSLDRVRRTLAAREAAGLRRRLWPRPAVDDMLDLAGNDYLGLSRHPEVVAAAAAAAHSWGAGATGSRLVSGTTDLHVEFEHDLAQFVGAPAALVFSSGWMANLAVLTALGGPDVTIVSDSANHASLIDGCRLSGSPIVVVPHRDGDKVEAALAAADTPHSVLVTDAVFSVDGDLAPLTALHAAARRHGALLVVDEAHSFGVIGDGGRGAVHAAGLHDAPDVVRTLTLSKSLGAQGGAVAAAPEVIDVLVNVARPFIFDTALAPPAVGAAAAALKVLRAEPGRADAVRHNARWLAQIVRDLEVETVRPRAAVVPAYLGDPLRALAAADACAREGARVGCFRPPSVPVGRSCLRLTARADLTEAQLHVAAGALAVALAGEVPTEAELTDAELTDAALVEAAPE